MLTISISELRKNISEYLEKVSKGYKVLIRDEKKQITIAQITKISSFDKKAYEKALLKASGIFSKQTHPEWATSSKITSWLSKNRLASDRTF